MQQSENIAKESEERFTHLNFTVDLSDPEQAVKRFICTLYPVDATQIRLTEFRQGNTNRLFLSRFSLRHSNNGTEHQLERLCRVFGAGTHELIDRDYEVRLMKRFTLDGHSPQLYHTFNNGFIYEFLPGKTVTNIQSRDATISRWIGQAIGRWHLRELPAEKGVAQIWPTLRKWLAKAQDVQKVLSQDEIKKIADEVEMIITELSNRYRSSSVVSIVCCHNDLTADNILLEQDGKGGEGKISFIDMEYCSYNYNAFDLGNYFCEWAGLKTEWEYYPNQEQQMGIIRAYWRAWKGKEPREEEMQELYGAANCFALVSHLFWGLWGLVQASQNPNGMSANGFDYVNYAKSRLGEYWKRRDEFLNLATT